MSKECHATETVLAIATIATVLLLIAATVWYVLDGHHM